MEKIKAGGKKVYGYFFLLRFSRLLPKVGKEKKVLHRLFLADLKGGGKRLFFLLTEKV